jgi:tight adherence protein C
MRILILILTGLSAATLVYAAFQVRLQRMGDDGRPVQRGVSPLWRIFRPIIQVLAAYNQRLDQERLNRRYRDRLTISGNPLHLIPVEFLAIQEACALGGLLMGLFLTLGLDFTPIMPLLLAMGGFFLPSIKLNQTIANRKRQLFNALPFCMDLLTLSVEAGLNFTAALEKVVQKGPRTPLRDELDRMLQDLRLGVSRRDALTGLAQRTDMYEIRAFTTALIQADKLGAPLGEALRTQSDIRRTERFQRAEKAAQEAPVKMLFPLLFFIFPAVFIVILVPIILKFVVEGM